MAKRAALKLADMKSSKGDQLAPAASRSRSERPDSVSLDGEAAQTKRGQTLRLPLPAWRQLKLLSVDHGRPAHDLLVEAVNDLFTKHGKPPIA